MHVLGDAERCFTGGAEGLQSGWPASCPGPQGTLPTAGAQRNVVSPGPETRMLKLERQSVGPESQRFRTPMISMISPGAQRGHLTGCAAGGLTKGDPEQTLLKSAGGFSWQAEQNQTPSRSERPPVVWLWPSPSASSSSPLSHVHYSPAKSCQRLCFCCLF